ncbi:MAG TPA: GNAT family N-acetyltransferase [Caulobacteraceae bacterium]|nr:GNAT family N-acetyltransferase [Caulobacteraceae bacterium]
MPFETRLGDFTLSDDLQRFDLARGHGWISRESYWAPGIPFEVFARSVRGSLTLGAYAPGAGMAAMARVVTDRATFGWICDVFVDRSFRGRGLGKAILAYIAAHPDLQGLRRMHLATRDAHALYAQYGFGPLSGVDRWMEVRRADPYGVSRPAQSAPASAP